MRRRKLSIHNPPPTGLTSPVLIHPNEVYSVQAARKALGLGTNALRHEVRAGHLRCARRCKRVWFLGQWLLDWLAGGVELQGVAEILPHPALIPQGAADQNSGEGG